MVARGYVVDEVSFDVERGKIGEFARATYAADEVYTSRSVAAVRGFADVVATPTYGVVTAHHRDQRRWVADLGLDITRVVMGSAGWEYRRPLTVGDHITATRRVVSDELRSGNKGTLRILNLKTEYRDQNGDVALVQRDVVIERPAP